MARNWTEEQLAAIGERGRTLLVSAAAGSGKTATLTERIIRTLTEEGGAGDISRMLIVTFTRSAAAELRARISSALNEVIAAGGGSAHLSRQLLLLPGAHISTIDSFCLDLVREHASRLGLSPSFRLADGAENRLLLHSVMNRLVEDCYDGACPEVTGGEEFAALVDTLTGVRSDRDLPELLLSLYDATQGYARAHCVIADVAEQLRADAARPPFDTAVGVYIREKCKDTLTPWVAQYEEMLVALAADPAAAASYLPAFRSDYEQLLRLLSALDADYGTAQERMATFRREALRPMRNKSEVAEAAFAMRPRFLATLTSLQAKFFTYSEQQWRALLPTLSDRVGLLGRLLSAFSDRVDEEKKRRNLCSFSDLSRGTLTLLCHPDGTPTALAAELSQNFDYVYVDEYQDVNEVQHRIFEALSGPRGRFMVGDVKQSIYGFRGAQPGIFASTREAFPRLEEAADAPQASLLLSCNFRSEPTILAFVNLIFGGLMESGIGARIGYRAEDALRPGRAGSPDAARVTLALFSREATEERDLEEPHDAEMREEELTADEEEGEESDREAEYVAAEIARLLREGRTADGRPLRPADIAILARGKDTLVRFARALSERGIASEMAVRNGFFLNPEILLTLSLLNVIDNPRRDIELAGLLRSPLFGFSMDDLLALRREAEADPEKKGATLYEALVLYVENHPDFARGRDFLTRLASYRHMAEGRPVDALIWHLYRETGLLSIAGADKEGDPAARRANLMLLYDYARRFEASSFRGLYHFIAYINEAIERGQGIDSEHAQSERTDTVRLMTVHASKGLEYPVCFLVGCGKKFNLRDCDGKILFDSRLGCAMKLRDESGYARLRNPIYAAIRESMMEERVEEEMRILYVALTRPRERLYVSATVKEPAKAVANARARRTPLGRAAACACRSYADMILLAMGDDTSFDLLVDRTPFENGAARVSQEMLTDLASDLSGAAGDLASDLSGVAGEIGEVGSRDGEAGLQTEEAGRILAARFDFAYPDRYLTDLPSKLSVSRLYPSMLDGDEGGLVLAPGLPQDALSPQGNALDAFVAEDRPLALDALWTGEEPLVPPNEEKDGPRVSPNEGRRVPLPLFMGGEKRDAARAGTATHLFMQFCDFDRLLQEGVEAELTRLLENRFLSSEDATLVRRGELEVFRRSSLLSKLVAPGGRLYRELRFHVRMPAAAFTEDPDRRRAYAGQTVLVQGVMDGVLMTADGELWLIDYKTDRLSAYEKKNRAAAEESLSRRHHAQLSYYAVACREMFGRLPDRVLLYSLALGDTIALPTTLPPGMEE